MKSKIIFYKSPYQEFAAQGEGYSKKPGYHIFYRDATDTQEYYLAYIHDNQLETSVWFYMKEDNLGIEIVGSDRTMVLRQAGQINERPITYTHRTRMVLV